MGNKLYLRYLQSWRPYLLGKIAKWVLKILVSTCRIETKGLELFHEQAKKGAVLLMLWHNRLIPIPEFFWKKAPQYSYAAFISQSRDGEILATLADNYSFAKAIRVPHDGRAKSLKRLSDHLRTHKDIILVTPDGPRGPRYKVKPGIAFASKETNTPIIPLSWCANRFWQLRSWDKMIIPKPFSTLTFIFGKVQEEEREKELSHLEKTLIEVDREAAISSGKNPE